MADPYVNYSKGLTSPGQNVAEITPDDASDLATFVRGINVAAAGDVRVTTVGGTTATIYVAAGVPFPLRISRVWATGTTATGIVGIW